MRKKKNRISAIFSILLLTALVLSACGASTASDETEPTSPEQASGPAPTSGAAGKITIDATDPCALLTEEQVAGAFGKDVFEVNTNTEAIRSLCEYAFDADYDALLQIKFYEGDAAKHYFAGLSQAGQESCDALLEKFFDVEFSLAPDSGQDVSGTPLSDLYRQYIAALAECMYIHTEDRLDVGENVVATETIFLNWSSSVAVLDDARVVEFTYQEEIPADVLEALNAGTTKESYYALADPYRISVLSAYTENLIALLQLAIGQ